MSVKKVTELFNDENNEHCIFDATNKCKMGDKCSKNSLPHDVYSFLIYSKKFESRLFWKRLQ